MIFHVRNRWWIAGSLEDSSSHATAAEGLEEGEVACSFFGWLPSRKSHILWERWKSLTSKVPGSRLRDIWYMIYNYLYMYLSVSIWGSFFGRPWRNSLGFMLPSLLLQPPRPNPGSKPGCHYLEKPIYIQKIQPAKFFLEEWPVFFCGKTCILLHVKKDKTARFDGFLTDDWNAL